MDYKAFVSSTYIDLKNHRAHVIRELQKAGISVDPMEEWTSAAQEPKVLSTDRLDGCKLCILLVARRRGHVPDGDKLSITQQEVEAAKQRGIDILPFLLDDDALWKTEWDERQEDEALRQWRADIEEGKCGTAARFNHKPDSVQITPALVRWVKDKGEGERTHIALSLYLKLIEQQHGAIQFVSLPYRKDLPNVPIERLYVEPAVADQWISPDLTPDQWPKTIEVTDAVANRRRLVLLGDPGSGKSTLVSWIAWQLAHHHHGASNPWTERLGQLIPLPLILRDLRISTGITWDALLDKFLTTPTGSMLALTNIAKLLEDGKAMIMLDGLDEIGSPAVRRDLRDAVWDGFARYPGCRWLLTSRIVGYEEIAFHEDRVEEIPDIGTLSASLEKAGLHYVAPFDNPRIERFADNWFLLREESAAQQQLMAKKFVSAIREDPATEKLGRIPNLLVMMALIYRVEANLPHGRARLYAKIAEAYLETIDNWRKIGRSSEEWTVRRRWLARVGFEMQQPRSKNEDEDDDIIATGSAVRQWIAAAMQETGLEGTEEEAAEFVDYLGRRAGLLLPRGEDQFAFLHLSFQEYFAAYYLKEKVTTPAWARGDERRIAAGVRPSDLRQYAGETVWGEAMIFLVESMATEDPDWLAPLCECLFDDDYRQVAEGNEDARGQAALLARLAVDPHAGFMEDERWRAVEACCRWEAREQKRMEDESWRHNNEVLRVLLGVDSASERTKAIEAFVSAAKELNLCTARLEETRLDDLTPLAGLPSLRRLTLIDTQVSDVTALAGLSSLEELELSGTQVSDVSALAGLSSLQHLELRCAQVSDVSALAGLSSLQTLHLQGTRLSDVSALAGLSSLQVLSLWGMADSDVSALAGFSSLQRLYFRGTQVSDVSALAGLSSLEVLDLQGTQVSDVSALAGLSNLQYLYLEDLPVSDVSALAGLLSLQELYLGGTPVSEVSALAGLSSLEYLDLRGTQVSDVSALAGLSSLGYLDLRGTQVSDVSALAGLSSLQRLDLSGTEVSDMSALAGLKEVTIHLDADQQVTVPEELKWCVRRM